MKKGILFLSTLILLSSVLMTACDNSVDSATEKAEKDSLRQVAVLDSTHKADSIRTVRNIDTLQALGIYKIDIPDSVCDKPETVLKAGVPTDPRSFNLFLMELTECNSAAWNKQHPDSTYVILVSEVPSENKVLFNTLPASTAEEIAKISKLILAGIVVEQTGGNPIATAVGTLGSSYAVDAYLEAAKTNDPMIILLPGAIPTKALIKDGITLTSTAYQAISKIDITKPFTVQIDAAKKVFITAEAAAKYVNDGVNAVINGVKVPILGGIPIAPPIPTGLPKKPSDIPTDPVTHWVLKKFHL